MKQNLIQQLTDTTTIQQIIYFVNSIFSNISVIFIPTRSWNPKVKNIVHRNPQTIRFCVLLSNALLYFEAASIAFAFSRFLLM